MERVRDISYKAELTPPFWREYNKKRPDQKSGVNSPKQFTNTCVP